MKTNTIEQRVAKAVLQKPKEIVIGDKSFSVAPPSIATLMLVSEGISLLPQTNLDKDKIVEGVLFVAKDCKVLGDIVATLILGSKHLIEVVTIKRNWFFRFLGLFGKKEVQIVDKKEELSKWLLEELSPSQLHKLFFDLIRDFQLGDFFGITTFLIEINLLRPTKVVNNEMTVFGQ